MPETNDRPPKDDDDSFGWPFTLAYFFLFAAGGVVYGLFAAWFKWFPAKYVALIYANAYVALVELEADWYKVIPGEGSRIVQLRPDEVAEGLIMIVGISPDDRNFISVIDRDGTVVQEWHPDWFDIWAEGGTFPSERRPQLQPGAVAHGAQILQDGGLAFNFEHLSTVKLSPCGAVEWKLDNLGHHSVHEAEDGSIWVSAEIYYPEGSADIPYPNHAAPFRSWTIQRLSADGAILHTKPVLDILIQNDLLGLIYLSTTENEETIVTEDTLHLNEVEPYPSGMPSEIFRPGDLIISLRNIDTVMVVDPGTWQVKFMSFGRFLRQHDPDFIGDDKIVVYDNRNLSPWEGVEPKFSRILEIDARDNSVRELYRGSGEGAFYSHIMGEQQLLPNGNLLITSTGEGRAFEVNPEGDPIWQYNNRMTDTTRALLTHAMVLPPEMDKEFFAASREGC